MRPSEPLDVAATEAAIDAEAAARAARPAPPPRRQEPPEPEAAGSPFDAVIEAATAARRAFEEFERRAPKDPCPGGCGGTVIRLSTPGAAPPLCAGCHLRKTHAAQFEPALDSVPEDLRWARLDSPLLAERVRRPDLIARGRDLARAERMVFVGPTRIGKTSLAVAILRAVVEAALDPDVPARVADRARRARFVFAYDLRTDRPAALAEAARASVLLIDDVGGTSEDRFRSSVAEVVHRRHAKGRATWITTGLQHAELVEIYKGPIVARMFERAEVVSFWPPRQRRSPSE